MIIGDEDLDRREPIGCANEASGTGQFDGFCNQSEHPASGEKNFV
jgi:hypothetical protein